MMGKDDLLRSIAETGYNVVFGAKKTFATHDLVEKVPNWVGFVSAAIGILGLVYDPLSAKLPSVALLIIGISAIYLAPYSGREYDKVAKELTEIGGKLRDLYRRVKNDEDQATAEATLAALSQRANEISISKQVFISGWLAHYKFFSEHQTGWMDEQLGFQTWRDMIPLSAKIVIILLGTSLLGLFIWVGLHLAENATFIGLDVYFWHWLAALIAGAGALLAIWLPVKGERLDYLERAAKGESASRAGRFKALGRVAASVALVFVLITELLGTLIK
jgi:hypothetical protein